MTESEPLLVRPTVFTSEQIAAAFTTRLGGRSGPPFDSLNLGLSTGDDRDTVIRNRTEAFARLGFEVDATAFAGQVHGTQVLHVARPGLYRETDGLVTDVPGLLLAITAADCAAVLLSSDDGRVIGACHAGWRGAVGGIVERTLGIMTTLGADPDGIQAFVSPCIGAESFEVGPEVAEQFPSEVVRHSRESDRAYVDLKADIKRRLQSEGVRPDSIEVSPHCTFRQVGRYFSHRAEHGKTGRMMGLIGIKTR